MIRINSMLVFAMGVSAIAVSAQEMPRDYQDVLSKLAKKGDYKDNVLKINIPRNDITPYVGPSCQRPSDLAAGWL